MMTAMTSHRTERAFTRADAIGLVAILFVTAVTLVCVTPAFALFKLRSSRERCADNLRQMSIALESYCGDYAGYFPSSHAYGSDPQPIAGKHWDAGIYQATNPKTQRRDEIRTANRPYFAGPSRYRCVYYGSRFTDTTPNNVPPFRKDTLNLAPIGLGFLHTLDYMDEAKALFCPKAKNVPNIEGMGAVCNLPEFETVGAGNEILFGDYVKTGPCYEGQSDRGILSSYNYRGVPLAAEPYEDEERGSVTVPWIRPARNAWPGCPTFKTPRLLGGRAMVCDSFDRHSKPAWEHGFVRYAHGNGYNVLYGDWHIAWIADPDEALSTSPWPTGEPEDASQGSDVCYAPRNVEQNLGFVLWHKMDEQAGIDVD